MPFAAYFDAAMHAVLGWLAVPEQGLVALAIVAFVAASLVPLSSEAVLLAVLAARPDRFWLAIAVATLANTAGSVTTYWLGRWGREIPHPPALERHVRWFERHGAPVLFFAWMPWIGDVLVLIAGWLKVNAWTSTLWIAIGKLARYLVLAQGWSILH